MLSPNLSPRPLLIKLFLAGDSTDKQTKYEPLWLASHSAFLGLAQSYPRSTVSLNTDYHQTARLHFIDTLTARTLGRFPLLAIIRNENLDVCVPFFVVMFFFLLDRHPGQEPVFYCLGDPPDCFSKGVELPWVYKSSVSPRPCQYSPDSNHPNS